MFAILFTLLFLGLSIYENISVTWLNEYFSVENFVESIKSGLGNYGAGKGSRDWQPFNKHENEFGLLQIVYYTYQE